MKILKIELQNLNSLKSNVPIVIDFENELFKDVGLFAITGATGAGKTTVLDAITIALYHQVPRFNNSSSKGTLIDVVSHGATEAFSRVTFENENVIYEASWHIRLASKSGKLLVNPQEEVSLKNLSTHSILSTQKRAVSEDVVKVTQLDYDQFLRSVMLAQGEFASFLTAKGSEKGRLLEQITGEQIYKKIGQGILDRKSREDNTLKEIKSKINADDVLNDDQKNKLVQKNQSLDGLISVAEQEMNAAQQILNWYLKAKEVQADSLLLTGHEKALTSKFEEYKTGFELLTFNDKAAPFKDLIQNLKRNEQHSLEKWAELKTLEEQLSQLAPQILNSTGLTQKETATLAQADHKLKEWEPLFDKITQLDGQLKNEADNQVKSKQQLDLQTLEATSLNQEKNRLKKEFIETEAVVISDEIFITQNKFLIDVDAEITQWATQLTTLKAHKKTLHEHEKNLGLKKDLEEQTATALSTNKKLLDNKNAAIERIEKEVSVINEQLSQNSLSDLLAQEKSLSLKQNNWKLFRNYAEETTKKKKALTELLELHQSFSIDIDQVQHQLGLIKKEIGTKGIAVTDAEKILDLEKSIAKYEDDRQRLLKGEPCGLCGATEHPFAEHLTSIGVTESEQELQDRKNQLKALTDSKSELDKKEVKVTTDIENGSRQIVSIKQLIKEIQSKSSLLEITCDLSDLTQINKEVTGISTELKVLNLKVNASQELQTKKDASSKRLSEQIQSKEVLKTKHATLTEKTSYLLSEIKSTQDAIMISSKTCTDLQNSLQNQLSKFNYELPSIETTIPFIENIKSKIITFHKTQKNIDELKASLKLLNQNLINIEKQQETLTKNQKDLTAVINERQLKISKLKIERTTILPLEITVVSKRTDLQSQRKRWSDQLDLHKKELQQLLDNNREKEAVKAQNIKERASLTSEFTPLDDALKTQIENSDFDSRDAIEKAFLNTEDYDKYTKKKEYLKEKQLRLETLKENNAKAHEALIASKTFEMTQEASKTAVETLKTKKDGLLAEKGEIKEAFRKDWEIRDRNQQVYKKIEAQEVVCGIWKELFGIIGNSKDAFNVYVQRLTLKHLLDLANVHLFQLNKRYSLKMEDDYKPKEELNFNLIDHYQTDQARLVDTSSGGEKFIISLALALGLSDLASKNVKIDSLFIDEGFGTLDKNTLETVISTLETLQSQGKMIGIISHVENLKERIPTQIQITKKSNGVSVVDML
jgi:exonuclease SbcC